MFMGCDNDTFQDHALHADFDLASATSSGIPLMSDFYCENRGVHRGLTMGAADVTLMPTRGPNSVQQDVCPSQQAQFLVGDIPPVLPTDPDFHLEGTTVIIENSSPVQVGNGLINLLRKETAAAITKVNRVKFSVKAYVHVDGLSCDVKVRVYRQEFGFAVEFQRRSGDSLAFQSLFRLASERLNSDSCVDSFGQHTVSAAYRPVTQVPREEHFGSSEQELSIEPLLEMSRDLDLHVQAEVAEALAAYAFDANVLWQVSTPDALQVRARLAGIDHISVAHPLRRLEAALAHAAQSNISFSAEGDADSFVPAVHVLAPPPLLMRL